MKHGKTISTAGLARAAATALLALMLPLSAHAETYRVDLIVFLDKSESPEAGRAPSAPDTGRAIDMGNAAALKGAGIELLPDDQFGLADQWQHLRLSKRYQPLVRMSWLQKDPTERGIALRVRSGESLAVSNGDARGSSLIYPVDGTVALMLGTYLNLDADLTYTQKNSDGSGASYRLREKRRMKRDEVHHLDSPKLGVLARVTKASGG